MLTQNRKTTQSSERGGLFGPLIKWSRAQSLWVYAPPSTCCSDEAMNAWGCRYDWERFGCVRESQPENADLLIVNGFVSEELRPHYLSIYERMKAPRYVMALGSCACRGGLFSDSGVESFFPVNVFVPGCPPRPEAILNGLLALQESILQGSA